MSTHLAAHAHGRRHRAHDVLDAVLLLFVVALVAFFWPSSLGGRTRLIVVEGHSMEPTIHFGDLVITWDDNNPKVGDIIVYHVPAGQVGAGQLIIHRVKSIRPNGTYETQGDNKKEPDVFEITNHDIVGSPVTSLPHVGRLIGISSSPLVLGLALGTLVTIVLWPKKVRSKSSPAGSPAGSDESPLVDFDALARQWLEEQLAGSAIVEERRPVRVDATPDESIRLFGETNTELGERAVRLGGPTHLGQAQQSWEAEVFDLGDRADLLGPEWGLDASDASLSHGWEELRGVPFVSDVDIDVARPSPAQRVGDVVPHVEVGVSSW